MSDILQIDFEEIEKVLPGSEDENSESLPSNTDVFKEDTKIGEEIKDESKQDNKSDNIIYSGVLAKSDTNRQTLNLSNFDSSLLWTNPSPTAQMNASTLVLDDDMSNYEYIMIEYKPVVTVDSTVKIFFPVNDLTVKKANSNVIGIGGVLPNGQTESVRYINKLEGYTDRIYVTSSQLSMTQGVPINIYGLNAKTSVTPDPTPTPTPNPEITTSGNVINNYYNNYFGVSENGVSWNLLNKPINQYTVSESLFLYQFLILFFVMMYLLIRRAVFKWK